MIENALLVRPLAGAGGHFLHFFFSFFPLLLHPGLLRGRDRDGGLAGLLPPLPHGRLHFARAILKSGGNVVKE